MASMNRPIPSLSELPLNQGDPPFSAWGLWENSQLGTLNYLTDEKVLKTAKEEIRTGERVGLNLPLDAIAPALLGRRGFEHTIINKAPRVINDDVITFNTQGSSQWDSFRHFAYQTHGKFYNGVTQKDIHGCENSTINGINAWASRGIAGRGVLIDYAGWAEGNGIVYEPLSAYPVPLAHVKKIIEEKKITLSMGDVLLLRTGYVRAYLQLEEKGRDNIKSVHAFPGLAQGQDTLEWLWENQFAAVAGDNPAFEVSRWGTPIGELFDLEALSDTCKRLNRWTFFISSAPLNYTGAVASPPNVLAFF